MKNAKPKATSIPSAELSGLKSHKAYYVQVRALDTDGAPLTAYNKAKKMWTLSKSGFRFLPPSGLSATAVGSTSLKVSFAERSGASKYLVRYSSYADFRRTDRVTVSSAPFTIPGLESSTTYYLDVRALSSSGRAISYYSDNFTKSPLAVTTGSPYRSSVEPDSKSSESLRVASFNIKCAGCDNPGELSWEMRRDAVKDTILGQKPDVIGLQEASQASLLGDTLNQYDDLVSRLGDPYRVANSYRYNCATSTSSSSCKYVNRGASESARIIYNAENLDLVKTGSLELDHASSKDNERYLAWALLLQISTGEEFIFATTHLQPNPKGTSTIYDSTYYALRREQARQIAAELMRVNSGGLPVILTGDMNTRWNSPGPSGTVANPQYEVFTAAGFHDPLNGGTKADRAKGPDATITSRVHLEYNSCNGYDSEDTPRDKSNNTIRQGNNIDYIYLNGLTATAWETVVRVDSSGNLTPVIPSDHNLIRADVSLP